MPAPATQHPRVPRSLILALLFQYGVGGAILPFIALLFRDRGLNLTQISGIFACLSAGLLFFPFLWGMLADRFISLNRLFLLLNSLIVITLAAFNRQSGFTGILFWYVAFAVCFTPSMILLNPLCFHHLENPRTQFGRLRSWGSIGWIIPSGVIYVWMALHPAAGLGMVINLGILLALVMILMSFRLPHLPPGAVHLGPEHAPGVTYLESVKRLLGNSGYMTALAVYFLVASSYGIQTIYASPLLEDAGLARKWIGPSQCVGVVVEIILFRWQTKLLSRLSLSGTILVGIGAMVLRHLVYWLSDNLWLLVASHALTGVVIVYHHIGISVLMNAIAPREVRSTAQTMMVLFGSGVGPMLSNVAIGWITKSTGQDLRMVFAFATGLAVLGGLLLVTRAKRLNAAVAY
jgi:MFS family permease